MSNATANVFFTYTGAQLRASSDPAAQAELARRIAKKPTAEKSVAALKSQGLDAEAAARMAAKATQAPAKPAKATKPAKAAKVAVVPAKPAFTRTEPVPAAKFDRKNLTTRMNGVEEALVAMAAKAEAQGNALRLLCAKLGVEVA